MRIGHLPGDDQSRLPSHPGLRALCAAFVDDPEGTTPAPVWAARFGMSARTLARAFRREVGMSFGTWRRRVVAAEAARRLASGQSVTTVALDLGYESLSAFTTMFRRTTGSPPSSMARDPGQRAMLDGCGVVIQ